MMFTCDCYRAYCRMYIATHLGWVVLSCAVLMFFRKRSIKTDTCNSSISLLKTRMDQSPQRWLWSEMENASNFKNVKGLNAAIRRTSWYLEGASFSVNHSLASQALISIHPVLNLVLLSWGWTSCVGHWPMTVAERQRIKWDTLEEEGRSRDAQGQSVLQS